MKEKLFKQVDLDDELSFDYPEEDLLSKKDIEGEFLEEWNSNFGTDYSTINEFNDGEELHKIIPAAMTYEDWIKTEEEKNTIDTNIEEEELNIY